MTHIVFRQREVIGQRQARGLIRHNANQCVLHAAGKAMYLGNAFMTTYYLAKGLDHTDIYTLQMLLYAAGFLAGLPIGRLADKYGSRSVLMFGTCLAVLQSIPFAFASSFWQFAPWLVLIGIQLATWANSGHALMDFSVNTLHVARAAGTRKDEATQELRRRLYERFLTHETRAHGIGYAAGILAGNGLYVLWGMRAPFLAQPFLYALCLVPVFRMRRPPMVESVPTMRLGDMWVTAWDTLRDRRVRSVALLTVFANCVSLTCFWELQPRMQMAGIGKHHFMWGYLAYAIITTVIAQRCSWLVERQRLGWAVVVALNILGALAAGFTVGWIGVVGLFAIVIAGTVLVGRLTSTFLRDALPAARTNRNVELSVVSTISVAASGAVGLGFGKCVDHFGLHASLSVFALLVVVVGLLAFASFSRAMPRAKG